MITGNGINTVTVNGKVKHITELDDITLCLEWTKLREENNRLYEINNQANRGWRGFILRLIGVNLPDKRTEFTQRLYPYSMNWLDCFRNPELAAKIYTRPFHLVDVTVMDDDEIVHHRRLGALTLLMKHSRSRDLMMQMDRLVQLIQDSLNEELAQVLFHYLLNGSEHVTLTFLQTLAQRLPRHEDNIMTLAEQLKQSGREEGIALGLAQGIERGIEQGIEQGVERGKLETARNMLNAGIARKMVLELTGLSEDQLKMLKH